MIRVLLAGILFVSSFAAGAEAQNSGLRRLTDRDDLLGWEAVGRLDIANGGFCTGTLIAPDLVLTAAHCALDRRTGRPFAPGEVMFRAGLRDGKSVADRQVSQIVAHPDFVANAPVSAERVRVDVALMRLEQPVSIAEADPFVLFSGSLSDGEVSGASYGRGREEAISRQRSCRILDRRQGIIAFDCYVTFGSSGSAIMAKSGARWQILSVVSAGGNIDGKPVGFGMELPRIVAELKAMLRRDAPQPQATIRRLQVGTGKSGSGAKFIRSGGS
ncbi:trypsin-like serine protease [Ruegeria sediminis]|uniref:Serine protease n=1 Tax=Ruegeria sediminis TaxID=2583820 RepID=A0ABY2WWI5_9RHOB|nr:trypsin-like serine protease [Ruegeria sediminis]TMV07122.1 trypsin-like serine protease [Ruegeria sediminis]